MEGIIGAIYHVCGQRGDWLMGTEAGDQALRGENLGECGGWSPGKRQGDLDLKPLALPPAPGVLRTLCLV